jgi:hypothetical protein
MTSIARILGSSVIDPQGNSPRTGASFVSVTQAFKTGLSISNLLADPLPLTWSEQRGRF